jgi:hypothetical protein
MIAGAQRDFLAVDEGSPLRQRARLVGVHNVVVADRHGDELHPRTSVRRGDTKAAWL